MKFVVERNWIDVLGEIWWPYGAQASLRINLDSYDVENIEDGKEIVTREDVEDWLLLHSGDFSRVIDFKATIGEQHFPWSNEENELAYFDTLGDRDY